MSKKRQIESIAYIIVIIIVVLAIVYIIGWIVMIGNNAVAKLNCDAMERNGYNTHLESMPLAGLPFKDCYIETKNGDAVSYDKFRVINNY